MTVKEDLEGCITTLRSLREQTRQPEQVVVVDGGSAPPSIAALQAFAREWPVVEVIVSPGANIAAGRNIATRAARYEIIASIDAGCRAAPDWLAHLIAPFETEPSTGFVAGNYQIEPRTLFEEVVGLATMRGQLDAIDPKTFNPSARSLAYAREVCRSVGGWPEWLKFSEDTLFDERVRAHGARWVFAAQAIVHWRPRTSWRGLARQFYNYGTGRGHTQIGRSDFLYNLRNLALTFTLAFGSLFSAWFLPFLLGQMLYHYVWAFHRKSLRIAQRTRQVIAYPLSLGIHWVVLTSHLAGFLMGSFQRWRDKPRYRSAMEGHLPEGAQV